MGIIPKHEQLERLSDQELIDRYNQHADNTIVGTRFYLDELSRRKQDHQNERMLVLTKTIRNLTITVTVLTVINAVLVAVTIFKA